MPWQQHVADVALEIDPDTGELFYEEVIVTVPRQSGKTTLVFAMFVWRCIPMARRLGPQTCTYLAQSGKMARRKLEREFAAKMRRSPTLREVPTMSRQRPQRVNEWKLSMNNGSENIMFGTESYLQIEAPTDKGSHGDVLDMPVIDEAFAHEDDLVEQAVDAATVTRRSPQSWVVSTAGNERSTFLARKVLAGRRATEDSTSRTAYFEWSVPEDEAFDDPKVWARWLPALGHTITEPRLLARLDKAVRNPDEVDEDGFEPGIAGFRRGYLNQWPRWPDFGGANNSAVDMAIWADLKRDGRIVDHHQLALDVSIDRKWASFAAAGRREGGAPHCEVFDRRPGTDWVLKRGVEAHRRSGQPIRILSGSPAAAFVSRFREAGVEVDEIAPEEFSREVGQFLDWVANRELRHLGDPSLEAALRGAEVAISVSGATTWARKSSKTDISPLVAVTLALGGLPALVSLGDEAGVW